MKGAKILVLGSTGMAGHVITTFFEETNNYDVYNFSHRKKLNEKTIIADVTELSSFMTLLDSQNYDIIINCTGVLNQFAEASKGNAILVNSYLPHFLEEKYGGTDTKIVHLSTDCVFSGKTGSYSETAFKDGDSAYDRTKALGEIQGGYNLTIRTSIIGPDMNVNGIGLFNWFMKSRGTINGYANAIWSGITTIELAKAIEKFVNENVSGIYHLVPGKAINKYELLLLLKDIFCKKDITIQKYDNPLIDKSLVNTRRDFTYTVADYPAMLVEMKDWISSHKNFYPHYL